MAPTPRRWLTILVLLFSVGHCRPAAAVILAIDPAGPPLVQTTTLKDANERAKPGVKESASIFKRDELKGPDLTLGYNDYLEFRLQLPSGYKGGVKIAWDSDEASGDPAGRQAIIPPEQLRADGRAHVYRVDMGPEPVWFGHLKSLEIVPAPAPASAPVASDTPAPAPEGDIVVNGFSVTAVRVGDQQGEVYQDPEEALKPGQFQLSSKHIRFVWDQKRAGEGVNEQLARGNLRNAEKCWQFYVKILRYREPCVGPQPGLRRKVNFSCIGPGFFGGGGGFNVDPGGLRVDPPSWVIPHELMHTFQAAQGGGLEQWHEAHANYCREQWIRWNWMYEPNSSNLESGYESMSHWYLPHGAFYYICWPFLLYLDENPDKMPILGMGSVAKLWQQGKSKETIYQAMNRLAPSLPIKDLIGHWARRQATYNYPRPDNLRRALGWTSIENIGLRDGRPVHAELRKRPDEPTWWQVPPIMAPQQGAYQIHELVVPAANQEPRTVTVNFRGLPVAGRRADWRASLVVLGDDWKERYVDFTPGFAAGPATRPAVGAPRPSTPATKTPGTFSATVKLATNENKLFLVVAATPDDWLNPVWDDAACPYQSHPAKARFPYEVQVTGANPRDVQGDRAGGGAVGGTNGTDGAAADAAGSAGAASAPAGHPHSNGGGFVADTASVDGGAFVGADAMVLDYARVDGNCRIEDHAVVSGHAIVNDGSILKDFAKVRDYAVVSNSNLSGSARAIEYARVSGHAELKDAATAKGMAGLSRDEKASNGGVFSGDAVLDGDFQDGRPVSNGFQFGFMPWNGCLPAWVAARHAPARLYVDYEFEQPNEAFAKDQYGVTDGYLVGKPKILPDAGHGGTLELNGKDQYVLLERSVSDWPQITVMMWIRPRGGPAGQPLLFFGADEKNCLMLTTRSAESGKLELTLRHGDTVQKVSSTGPLGEGGWSHLAFTLDGQKGRLYVAGKLVGEADVTIRADQLMTPNTNATPQHNYLGRGLAAAPTFTGRIDAFRVYSKAMDKNEITAAMK